MPIRINLLADRLMAEEMHRRDPVRRSIVYAVMVVLLAITCCVFLQMKKWVTSEEVNGLVSKWNSLNSQNSQVMSNLNESKELEAKLSTLYQLASNRFLWAPVFDALQHSVIDHVRLIRLDGKHNYIPILASIKPKAGGREIVYEKNVIEKITLLLEARDSSGSNMFTRYKDELNTNSFLKNAISKANAAFQLTDRGISQVDPTDTNVSFVGFKLECVLVEQTR